MPSSHQDTKTIAYNTATLRTGNALGASSDYFECLGGRLRYRQRGYEEGGGERLVTRGRGWREDTRCCWLLKKFW